MPFKIKLSRVRIHKPMNQQVRTLLCVSICLCSTAFAAAADWSSLKIGYQSTGKVGKWIPISAKVSGLDAGQAVNLQAAFTDPRGDTCIQTVASATADSSGQAVLRGYFCVGRLLGTGLITVSAGDVELCRQFVDHSEEAVPNPDADIQTTVKMLRVDVPLLLTTGEVAGVPELLRNTELFAEASPVLEGVQISSAAEMPTDARGLDAIDTILLVSDFDMNKAQVQALQQWVHSGGNLIFSLGDNVTAVLQTEFGKWADGFFELDESPRTIRELSALQSYVSGASRLETGRRNVPMAISRSNQNFADVDTLAGPLIASQSVGAGTIKFLGIDLNERPINKWISLPQFYEVLMLGEKLSKQSGYTKRSSRISQSGVSDLSTQMMATVDASPQVGKWSTWSILAMMIGWLILIGPLDYLLVTRLLKKPHLTWLTFPLFICLGVFGIATGLGSTTESTLNQLHLLDVSNSASGSTVHTRSWMSLSSSETARADLLAQPETSIATDAAATLLWSGRAEDVYGGMYRAGGIGLGRQTYTHDIASPTELKSLPLLVDGSRQLISEWYATPQKPLIESELEATGYGLLSGSFTHSLPAPIEDFIIIHGNRVYRTQQTDGKISLAPGATWQARSDNVAASDLKAYLNGSRIIKSAEPIRRGSTQTQTPYNAKSDNPVYILTMASFYNIAGGSKYVGLSQEYLRNAEVSDTIRLNHAVLIGTTQTPATALSVDGKDLPAATSNTVVRLLIPVNRRPAGDFKSSQEAMEKILEDAKKTDRLNPLEN